MSARRQIAERHASRGRAFVHSTISLSVAFTIRTTLVAILRSTSSRMASLYLLLVADRCVLQLIRCNSNTQGSIEVAVDFSKSQVMPCQNRNARAVSGVVNCSAQPPSDLYGRNCSSVRPLSGERDLVSIPLRHSSTWAALPRVLSHFLR